MQLSEIGQVVNTVINNIPIIYECAEIDKYVIMPNHIHIILLIKNDGRTVFAPTLSRVIKQFKAHITKQLGYSIWQKSFHDHIIRNGNEYVKIWQYIDENPLKWNEDCYFPI